MPRIKAASIAIHQDGRFLLVRRGRGAARGQYAFPGGRLEPGETAVQAVLRELFEETGLTTFSPRTVETIEIEAGADVYELQVFRSAAASGELRAGDDADTAGWYTIKDMRSLDITASTLAIAETIAGEVCCSEADALDPPQQAGPDNAS